MSAGGRWLTSENVALTWRLSLVAAARDNDGARIGGPVAVGEAAAMGGAEVGEGDGSMPVGGVLTEAVAVGSAIGELG